MPRISEYLAIAVGGALGALSRYLVAQAAVPSPGEIPWPTLTVNVAGSFLLGYFSRAGLLGHHQMLFVLVGFLGSLTTFSTLAFEIADRSTRGLVALAGTYMALTLGLGILAAWLGSESALRADRREQP